MNYDNEMYAKIDRLNNKINFLLKSRGNLDVINLKTPPNNWSYFDKSKTDKWKLLKDFSEDLDVTACLYKGVKGSKILAHKHPNQTEHISVENVDGKILVVTKTFEKELNYTDSIVFSEGEEHIVFFKEDTTLLCRWKPRLKNDEIESTYKKDI